MTPAELAVKRLRQAADALDALPIEFRRVSAFGPNVSVEALQKEADHVEAKVAAISAALGVALGTKGPVR